MDRHGSLWDCRLNWHKIDIRLTLDWYWIGNGLSLHWQWIGLACLLWAVNDGVLRHIGGSPIVLVPSGLCTMSVWNGSRLEWPLPIECRSMSDCPYGLAMEWHRIYIGLTMFVKSSSVETLRSVPFSKLVPRLDTSWSPVSNLGLGWPLSMRAESLSIGGGSFHDWRWVFWTWSLWNWTGGLLVDWHWIDTWLASYWWRIGTWLSVDWHCGDTWAWSENDAVLRVVGSV